VSLPRIYRTGLSKMYRGNGTIKTRIVAGDLRPAEGEKSGLLLKLASQGLLGYFRMVAS
jgi:hypothetical protein